METIKKLDEINYTNPSVISFLASVLSVDSDGDEAKKKPFKATLKLEESGENIQICSWKFDVLDTYKKLVNSDSVYKFEARPSVYNETKQIRVGDISDANMKSSKKILKTIEANDIKRELTVLIDQYIPATSIYREIINNLVLTNDKFWIWPAATRMHHAYPGGLAKHTLNVTKGAVAMWLTYSGSNLNIATIVAGAVLHDIGKLMEYNQDGSRTIYGDFIPHPVSGYEMVCSEATRLRGIDPRKNPEIIMLGHIILSHHGKIEYEAPVLPNILEAVIVSKADENDATFEACDLALDNTNINTSTETIRMIDTKLFKWHN